MGETSIPSATLQGILGNCLYQTSQRRKMRQRNNWSSKLHLDRTRVRKFKLSWGWLASMEWTCLRSIAWSLQTWCKPLSLLKIRSRLVAFGSPNICPRSCNWRRWTGSRQRSRVLKLLDSSAKPFRDLIKKSKIKWGHKGPQAVVSVRVWSIVEMGYLQLEDERI